MSDEAPTLGLQDFQNILKVLDYCADQGAFKSWSTIQQVFAVRNRYDVFVKYAETPTEEEAPTLGLQDFKNILIIFDLAADEGAFKGWSTIQQVLIQRTRIVDFVDYIEALNAEKAA